MCVLAKNHRLVHLKPKKEKPFSGIVTKKGGGLQHHMRNPSQYRSLIISKSIGKRLKFCMIEHEMILSYLWILLFEHVETDQTESIA